MCPSSSKTFPSSSQTVSLFASLNTCKTQKSSFSKKNLKTTLQLITPPIFVTTLKQILLTHPQCLLYPLLNPTFHFYSYTIFFHHSFSSQNNLLIIQWNAYGIRPRLTKLIQFFNKSVQSHLFSRISPIF